MRFQIYSTPQAYKVEGEDHSLDFKLMKCFSVSLACFSLQWLILVTVATLCSAWMYSGKQTTMSYKSPFSSSLLPLLQSCSTLAANQLQSSSIQITIAIQYWHRNQHCFYSKGLVWNVKMLSFCHIQKERLDFEIHIRS